MSKTDIMIELPKLTPDERREILDKIWGFNGAVFSSGRFARQSIP
jgi:hypothetical protein